MDRAGTLSTLSRRRMLHNVSTPLMTGIGLPATLTAAGPNAFTPNFATVVEANFTNLRPSYLGLTAEDALTEAELIFPATLYNARFNDVIGLNGNLSTSTPFTSGVNYYTNIEQTTTAGAITAPIVNTPDSASARVVNVAGQPSTWFTVPFLGANVGTDAVTWATKSPFLISWTLGTDASAWNAPANGLKAVVTATTNQINSPFTRVDFYEQINGNWQYIGQVNAQATPCTSPAQNCEVYIADNGTSRVWTYRLTSTVNGTDSLLGSTTLGALSGGARRFIAVASNGTAGRVLSTNVATASSTVLP